jgi:hypothetical protein
MDAIGKAKLEVLQELKLEVMGYLQREIHRAHVAALSIAGSVEADAREHELSSVICVVNGLFTKKETTLRGASEHEKEGEGGQTLPHR